jgi:hypothetical protein
MGKVLSMNSEPLAVYMGQPGSWLFTSQKSHQASLLAFLFN